MIHKTIDGIEVEFVYDIITEKVIVKVINNDI